MPKTISVDELGGFLEGVTGKLKNPEAAEVLGDWNDVLAGDLAAGFLSSQSPDGHTWAALKHPRPKGHNQGTRPLIDTGALMQSVISAGPDHIEETSQESTILGTSVEYAGIQQYGSQKKNIPVRPFIGIPDETLDVAAEMLAKHVITIIDAI